MFCGFTHGSSNPGRCLTNHSEQRPHKMRLFIILSNNVFQSLLQRDIKQIDTFKEIRSDKMKAFDNRKMSEKKIGHYL